MRIKRLINNNMVVAVVDDEDVIVLGRGIGFAKKAGDVVPSSNVEQIYRMQDPEHIKYLQKLISDASLEDVRLAIKLATYVKSNYSRPVNETLLIVIMDHVGAAKLRHSKGLDLVNPMLYDIKNIYPEEYEIGLHLLSIIEEDTGMHLLDDEAGFLALNIVNAQTGQDMGKVMDVTTFVRRVLDVVRAHFSISVSPDSPYFSRFLTHLKYLAVRILDGTRPVNGVISQILNIQGGTDQYEDIQDAINDISNLTETYYGHKLDNDERMYLLVHLVTLLKAGEQGILQ